MVKTRNQGHAQINIDQYNNAINIFGKTLTIRVVTETLDEMGRLTTRSSADTLFKGDLQFGIYLDQNLVHAGFLDTGDAVLYVSPTALSILPAEQDIILDGNALIAGIYQSWEIVGEIEAPMIQGSRVHRTYRCRKRDNITVT